MLTDTFGRVHNNLRISVTDRCNLRCTYCDTPHAFAHGSPWTLSAIEAELARLGPKLVNMQKHNQVAIYVSNTALDGFDAFRIDADGGIGYNDVLRHTYDALYRINVETDLLSQHIRAPT